MTSEPLPTSDPGGIANAPRRPVTVYLLRHCDVENPRQILYGFLPGFPLSERGRAQAHLIGAALAESGVTTILSSPLERTVETAAIIASHLPGARTAVDDELREAEFGHYLQGAGFREVPWRRPRWWVHHLRRGILPGDESAAEMAARVGSVVNRLVDAGDPAICVSHSDPIRAYMASVMHRRRGMDAVRCDKGAGYVLTFAASQPAWSYLAPADEPPGAPAGHAP